MEDDSGVPLRALSPDQWTVRFFGAYRGTNGIFAKYHQPDLLEAYRQARPPPLEFSFGYEADSEHSALIIAVKK